MQHADAMSHAMLSVEREVAAEINAAKEVVEQDDWRLNGRLATPRAQRDAQVSSGFRYWDVIATNFR